MLIEEFHEIQKLDAAIDKVLTAMQGVNTDTDEYDKMSNQLTKLIKNKEIIGNLLIKANDSLNKNKDIEEGQNLKNATLARQKLEFEEGLKLKNAELEERRTEFKSTIELREAELQLKQQEREDRLKVSMDTLAVIGANIAGIVLILGYEKINVVTSKALSFITKLR